ncbi:uncharacterized protein KGF55_001394 [Candida pseudojiufengensis]|uniref:uncharacterized protein n=1 Tax=Candida pseudojiufengensis TaxID=497109 RepID=UPI0022255E2D|nr:uncharacterized protein KGF55_001394 [Candida pseudojiufengensis]KAI5965174.1 hypothetical protein KGF55_001394 [Candida pseudojiufengensis]
MKMNLQHLFTFFILNIAVVLTASSQDITSKIKDVETLFATQGPTSSVLQEFDQIINDIRNSKEELKEFDRSLAQLLFKRALIEINLNKENNAIIDLKDVLKIDPSLKTARNKLIDLYIHKGDVENLEHLISKENNSHVKEIVELYKYHLTQAQTFLKSQKYEDAINELNNLLIISKSNYEIYELFLKLLLEIYKINPQKQIKLIDEEMNINKVIIRVLQNLLKIQPVINLKYYSILSKFILFTELQFDQSNKIIKNCLRIDNDFKSCGEISKFYSKFQNFLKILENYSILNGYLYPNLAENEQNFQLDDEDFENYKFNFEEINQFLFHDELKLSRLEKKNNLKIKNNYEYLLLKGDEFLKEFQLGSSPPNNLLFIQDLNKISCESYIQIGSTSPTICKKCKNDENPFLPELIPEIDKLLKQKNYDKVESIMQKFSKNVQKTSLFKNRFKKVESYKQKFQQDRMRQQQQQQQQHQQQQQQYFRQQQQQQQQFRQNQQPKKPANDYYKILDIPKDADDKTIRKAYRTQTLKYHPDKYKGKDLTPEQIEKKMQDINKAYEILSNKELRERFDRGDDPNDPLTNGQSQPQWASHQQPGGGGFGGFGGQKFQFNFGGSGGGGDFFQQFFGNMGGQGQRSGGGPKFNSHQKVKIKKNKKRT